MENIIFRAIIVLSVLSAAAGALIARSGTVDGDVYQRMVVEALEKDRAMAPERKKCVESIPFSPPDRRAMEINNCYINHSAYAQLEFDEWVKKRDKAHEHVSVGIVLFAFVSPLLFALFFVIRWILTGRWTRARSSPLTK